MALTPAVLQALAVAGLTGETIDPHSLARPEVLAGGDNSTAWRVRRRDGNAVVVKAFGKPDRDASPAVTALGTPADLYEVEAEGLAALRTPGGFVTPEVLAVTPSALVLESLAASPKEDAEFWDRAGRALAATHGVTNPRFGWHRDGWLGSLRQENTWHEDGYTFYATHRILRYLDEPPVRAALRPEDRDGLHRLCERLPLLVPPAPASLTHGDLAPSNVLASHDGRPALIDPAASWTWAEVDLSMMYWIGLVWPSAKVPDRFFDAYAELRPVEPDWRERAPLLHLRELLSLIAHGDKGRDHAADIRAIIRTFR